MKDQGTRLKDKVRMKDQGTGLKDKVRMKDQGTRLKVKVRHIKIKPSDSSGFLASADICVAVFRIGFNFS